MLIVYYNGSCGWCYCIESVMYRWYDTYYPPNACEWIVPGTIEC